MARCGCAASAAPGGEKVAVIPSGEPLFALRYYLPQRQRDIVVSGGATFEGDSRTWAFRCGREPVAIVQLEFAARTSQCDSAVLSAYTQEISPR